MGVDTDTQTPDEPRGALGWLWLSALVVALDQASKGLPLVVNYRP